MRSFFVRSLEWLLGLFVVVALIGLGATVWGIATSGAPGAWMALVSGTGEIVSLRFVSGSGKEPKRQLRLDST